MKAIIVIHGYLTNEYDFECLYEKLNQMYDKVVIARIPGHGQDNIRNFTSDKTQQYICALCDETFNNYDHVDLLGYSMGGALSMKIASKYNVNKVVLLAPANKYFSALSFSRRLLTLLKTAKNINSDKDLKLKDKIGEFTEETKELLKYDLKSFKLAYDHGKYFRVKNGLEFTKLIRWCNKDITEIKQPLLVIWGYLDELVPYESVKYCLSKCTNELKLEYIVKDIGHMMLRSPNVYDIPKRIYEFLGDTNA